MNGVTILNEYVVNNVDTWRGALAGTSMGIAVIFLILLVCAIIDQSKKWIIICSIGLVISIGLSILFAKLSINYKKIPNHTEYQVIISDDVSINEFYDTYEVLDQDGLIYTVREREFSNE